MAEIIYLSGAAVIPAETTHSYSAWVNGSASSGGDYVGPVALAVKPTELNQVLNPSTVSVKFVSRTSDLTSECFYLFNVTNNNPFPVAFQVDFFANGD